VFLVWAWDALSFGATGFLAIRSRRKGEYVWGGWPTGLLALNIALIYFLHVLTSPGLLPIASPTLARSVGGLLEFAVAPLLLHAFFLEERPNLRAVAIWKIALILLYASCAIGFVTTVRFPPLTTDAPGFHADRAQWIQTACLAFACVAITTLILQTRSGGSGGGKRKFYAWLAPLFGAIVLLHWLDLLHVLPFSNIVQELLPACLLFILAYQIQPLTFDILIKEITFYYFVLAAVYAVWWILPAWFIGHRGAYPLLILCVWPIVSAAPWFHRRWVRWLDRVVLGRRFTPNAARRYFLIGLERAVTERELARCGERGLQEIFQGPARILLESPATPRTDAGMSAAIRLSNEVCGTIEVASRVGRLQFMGQDLALLESLTAEFSILLDNLRLREAKIERERREQDLRILVTQSELKALRAQINPHFLFNSLSAIAGLIAKDPAHARETVEQLAEVFRYTLFRSEKEWVRLGDELEFVTAYLDVERARFGSRLQVAINVAEAAQRVMVPAMVLQVLVENAIKHGVSSVRGAGIVRIRGECRGSRLWVEVRDNGAGPSVAAHASNGNGSGFGLHNVQERLNLYFPGEATLGMARADSMTVVTLEMPVAAAPEMTGRPRP
jgi:GAF domain-containing protein